MEEGEKRVPMVEGDVPDGRGTEARLGRMGTCLNNEHAHS